MPADVDELVVRVADVCSYKWDMLQHRPHAFLISAFAGGAFVVFGSMLALSVSAGVSNNLAPGLANLLMGLVFMFSLVIIMFGGMTLVTADMAVGIIGIFHRRISWPLFFKGILIGYIGNFIGSMFFMWLLSKGGSFASSAWLLQAHAMAAKKTGMPAIEIFAMAVVCTWTLQTAAFLYIKANEDIAKIAMAAYGPLGIRGRHDRTLHCQHWLSCLALVSAGFLAHGLYGCVRSNPGHAALGVRTVWLGS